MASIKNLKQQEKAVQKVNGMFGGIKEANSFLKGVYAGKTYQLSYYVRDDDYGTTTKATLLCEDKETFTPMVLAYKKSLIKELREIVEEHNLLLSEAELELMEEN